MFLKRLQLAREYFERAFPSCWFRWCWREETVLYLRLLQWSNSCNGRTLAMVELFSVGDVACGEERHRPTGYVIYEKTKQAYISPIEGKETTIPLPKVCLSRHTTERHQTEDRSPQKTENAKEPDRVIDRGPDSLLSCDWGNEKRKVLYIGRTNTGRAENKR